MSIRMFTCLSNTQFQPAGHQSWIMDLPTCATTASMCCETPSQSTPYRFIVRAILIHQGFSLLIINHQSSIIAHVTPTCYAMLWVSRELRRERALSHMKKEINQIYSSPLSDQPVLFGLGILLSYPSKTEDIGCG